MMIRAIAALVAACMTCLPCNASAQPSAEQVTRMYEQTWYGTPGRLAVCTERLRELLAAERIADFSERLRAAQVQLRSEQCLDEYSMLIPAPKVVAHSVPAPRPDPRKVVQITHSNGYMFIRIREFSTAFLGLAYALRKVDKRVIAEARAIVIDLRGNLGGFTADMREVLDMFFSPRTGVSFMRAMGTEMYGDLSHTTTGRGTLAGSRLKILVDKNTASAAEWMTSILCFEWFPDRCEVIGERTMGKPVVQCLDEQHGIEMRITCGEWLINGEMRAAELIRGAFGTGIPPNRVMRLNECEFDYTCVVRMIEKRHR